MVAAPAHLFPATPISNAITIGIVGVEPIVLVITVGTDIEAVRRFGSAIAIAVVIFHALVREESNFNKDIRSHADAWGLAQLLPSTAKEVAGWMGTTVSTSQLTDPATNLRLGARYFESLMQTNGQNPQLALACYNAGCGNVKKWRARFGDLPTDQFVESIPFRETRHYAKRVSRTWQIYHLLYDDGPAFPDLSAFNHSAFTP